jgi:hypothetical protein
MASERDNRVAQLERILHSQTLRRAALLKSFLRFVVLKAVDQQSDQVKESTIAIEVFGRDSGSYDPRTDPIVRVQASKLRAKLEAYYAYEGQNDRIVISLPKGHYFPAFSYNVVNHTAAAERSSESQTTDVFANQADVYAPGLKKPALKKPALIKNDRWLKPAAAGLSVLTMSLILMCVNLYSALRKSESALQIIAGDEFEREARELLWGDFLRSPQPLLLVYGHAGASSAPQSVQLTPDSESPDFYSASGEVGAIYTLGNLFWKAGQAPRVRHISQLGRDYDGDQAKRARVIVIGSEPGSFFHTNLPQATDFVFKTVEDHKGQARRAIINLRPQGSEERIFSSSSRALAGAMSTEEFGLLSLLKGRTADQKLMILAGATPLGTQAIAEYVTNPQTMRELIGRLNSSSDHSQFLLPTYYQVVLKIEINNRFPVKTDYVLHHILQ